MFKQGIETINTEFIQTFALSQVSFVHFWPYVIWFPGLLFLLTFVSKSKKTLETSLDVTLFFNGWEFFFFFWMLIICKIGVIILFKRITAETFVCCPHTFRFLDCIFFFLYRHFAVLMTPKSEKRINKALSKQPKQFLFHFYFLIYKNWVSKLNLRLSFDLRSVSAWINP